ncbi:MAG: metallophosphoesterase [Ruminococcaceae bacterium]|nr:metallophosphoesterase [Oscillospiraceae bacterium]
MKILTLADEECLSLWDYYSPGKLKDYDMILSCGDLKASYLSFLVTMGKAPVFYVHGNHDGSYRDHPPEGCECIEDRIITYKGLRILGLGGSMRYNPGDHQYTDTQMRRRIRKLWWQLRKAGGVDIVVTHAAPLGLGDADDYAHRGSEALRELLDKYRPRYLVHGHIHLSYGHEIPREMEYNGTKIINAYERYVIDVEPVSK